LTFGGSVRFDLQGGGSRDMLVGTTGHVKKSKIKNKKAKWKSKIFQGKRDGNTDCSFDLSIVGLPGGGYGGLYHVSDSLFAAEKPGAEDPLAAGGAGSQGEGGSGAEGRGTGSAAKTGGVGSGSAAAASAGGGNQQNKGRNSRGSPGDQAAGGGGDGGGKVQHPDQWLGGRGENAEDGGNDGAGTADRDQVGAGGGRDCHAGRDRFFPEICL